MVRISDVTLTFPVADGNADIPVGRTEKRRECYFAPSKFSLFVSMPELQRRGLRHLMRARLIRRRIGGAFICLHQIIGNEEGFDFFSADVRQHPAIDLDARAEHLPAFFDHFLALGGIVDDVPVFVRQIVFAHDRAHALAPAAARFQVSNDFWFIHKVRNLPYSTTASPDVKAQSCSGARLFPARLWTLNFGLWTA